MGITTFKIFIWRGISSDIRSEITFMAPHTRRRKTKFPTVYPPIYLYIPMPIYENFENSYPLSGFSILLHGVISLPGATS